MQIQEAHAITQTDGETSRSSAILVRIGHGNCPWSSPWTAHSPGFTLTPDVRQRAVYAFNNQLLTGQPT